MIIKWLIVSVFYKRLENSYQRISVKLLDVTQELWLTNFTGIHKKCQILDKLQVYLLTITSLFWLMV